MIRLPQWRFFQDPADLWHWTCARDYVSALPVRGFGDRTECFLDALATVARLAGFGRSSRERKLLPALHPNAIACSGTLPQTGTHPA